MITHGIRIDGHLKRTHCKKPITPGITVAKPGSKTTCKACLSVLETEIYKKGGPCDPPWERKKSAPGEAPLNKILL